MSKFVYTEDMVTHMKDVCASGVTEALVEGLCEEFDFPRRSVTAKLRKLNFDVPKKPSAPPVFNKEETDELKSFLSGNTGVFTAEEIASQFMGGKFSSRQINGKALSLEMTSYIKPAEKKVTPKTYTDAEEVVIRAMVEKEAFIEDIAGALNKTVPSVRGKLLSMGLKAVQRDKKTSRNDPYEGIENMLEKNVEDLATHFDKTPRGVRTVLTRRKLSCANYTPKSSD